MGALPLCGGVALRRPSLNEYSVYRSRIANTYGSIEKIRKHLRVLARYRHAIKGTADFEEYITHAAMKTEERVVHGNGARGSVFSVCGPWVTRWQGNGWKWELKEKLTHPDDISCVSCREQLGYPIDRLRPSFRKTGAVRPPRRPSTAAEITRDVASQLKAFTRRKPTTDAEFKSQVIAALKEIVDLLSEQRRQAAKEFLNTHEAAAYLGVSVDQIRAFCQLEGLKHGRLRDQRQSHLRLKKEWIDEWMLERVVANKF